MGNQTTDGQRVRYAYDALGMLASAVPVTSGSERRMIYTADDERIGLQIDQSLIRWRFRDFTNGQVLREWKGNGSGWMWEEDFVYGEGKLIGGEREAYMGGKRHFSLDHLGSVRMITSDNRLSYARHDFLPFGVEKTQSTQEFNNFNFYRPEPMNFAGHERDFSGAWDIENTDYLDDMHARYYNPNMGRFLSVDKLGGKSSHPQTLNRYSYARSNPLKNVDPDGNCSVPAGLGAGEVGLCIESFIAAKWIGLGRGDNRTFSGTDPSLSARIRHSTNYKPVHRFSTYRRPRGRSQRRHFPVAGASWYV